MAHPASPVSPALSCFVGPSAVFSNTHIFVDACEYHRQYMLTFHFAAVVRGNHHQYVFRIWKAQETRWSLRRARVHQQSKVWGHTDHSAGTAGQKVTFHSISSLSLLHFDLSFASHIMTANWIVGLKVSLAVGWVRHHVLLSPGDIAGVLSKTPHSPQMTDNFWSLHSCLQVMMIIISEVQILPR